MGQAARRRGCAGLPTAPYLPAGEGPIGVHPQDGMT